MERRSCVFHRVHRCDPMPSLVEAKLDLRFLSDRLENGPRAACSLEPRRRTATRLLAASRNPNEIPSQSPRMPPRGCDPSVPARAPDLGHNPVGVVPISERAPEAGVANQPWAGSRNPFGIVRGHVSGIFADLL